MRRIRTEIELLICCTRTALDSAQTEQVSKLLQQEIDWAYLLRMAHKHKLRPLLYHHLNATCPEAVPERILDQLQEDYYRISRRNFLLTGELLKLLNLFAAHGICAIPYKGPTLALAVYGNLALREFTDLDILVQTQNVRQTAELLKDLGYQRQFQLGNAQEADFLYHKNQHLFRHAESRIAVEIHWAFEQRYFSVPLDPESLKQRIQTLSIGSQQVWLYAPEDLFLLLCVHGFQHFWEQLRWICDLAEVVRVHESMDWSRIMTQARELGVERLLLLGVHLTYDLLDTAFPGEVMEKLEADPAIKALAEQVQNQLEREADDRPGFFETYLFHLRAREHWRDKIRYCFGLAVTPSGLDWSLLQLPPALSPLYYAVRPFRLAAKYGLGLTSGRRRKG